MTFALLSILEAILKTPGKSGSANLMRGMKLGNTSSNRPDKRALSFDAQVGFCHFATAANLSNLCKMTSRLSLPSTNVGSFCALALSSLSTGPPSALATAERAISGCKES